MKEKIILCSVEGCGVVSRARGLCKKHYTSYSRAGTLPEKTEYRYNRKRLPEKERFFNRIQKSLYNDCWLWIGNKNRQGYGIFFDDSGKEVRAHRYSYFIEYGHLDKTKYVCHTCDNPSCVNPKHLWEGTAKDNNEDCRNKNRAKYPPDQKGENHSQHKLTEDDVLFIRQEFKAGVSQADLMRKYNMSRNTIHKICKNKTWKHIGE